MKEDLTWDFNFSFPRDAYLKDPTTKIKGDFICLFSAKSPLKICHTLPAVKLSMFSKENSS